jgi:hypothetical protein
MKAVVIFGWPSVADSRKAMCHQALFLGNGEVKAISGEVVAVLPTNACAEELLDSEDANSLL